MKKIVSGIFGVIGLLVAILGIILGWVIFPDMVTNEITKNVELDVSPQYKRFEELPLPFSFNVYMFNVTNTEDILNGTSPVMQEIGPYVYRETRKKSIASSEDEVITYTEQQTFLFDEDASEGLSDSDVVTILNPALTSTAQLSTNPIVAGIFMKYYEKVFGAGQNHPFLNITVGDFLFNGYTICEDPQNLLCLILSIKTGDYLRNMKQEKDGSLTFTFFNHKNTTDDGVYKVNDGSADIKKLAWIHKWNGGEYLKDMWVGEKSICNKIQGRDSVTYAPFAEKADEITIFNTDICRTVKLNFEEDYKYRDVTAYRYVVAKDTLDEPNEEKDTMCYCLNVTHGFSNPNGCVKNGIMELNNCYGAPIILSWPHFLWADKEYQDSVEGIRPDESKHLTFVDLEPTTGTPLRGSRRIQLNMFLKPVEGIDLFTHVNSSIMPILWLDEGLEIDDSLYGELQSSFVSKLELANNVKWGLIGAGIAIIVITIAAYFATRKHTKETVYSNT